MNDDFSTAQNHEHLARITVIALSFLIPVFIIPLTSTPFQFTKVMLALLGVLTLVVLFSFSTFRARALSLSYAPLLIGLGVLPVSYLIASVLSSHPPSSFFGYRFEVDTFGFVLVGSLLSMTIFWTVTNRKTIFSALFGVLVAGWVAMLFQLIQIVFAAPTGLPAFASTTDNLIGKWNDFGLFIALIASLVLIVLSAITISRRNLFILYVTLAAGVFLLAVINFTTAWILLSVASFLVLIFSLVRVQFSSPGAFGKDSRLNTFAAGIVLLLALGFVTFGTSLSAPLQAFLGVEAFEVRPSLEGTRIIAEAVYQNSPFFGSGPNTFGEKWFLYRPSATLATPFWNVPFNAGSSLLTTSFVTGGLFVGLSWVFLILLVIYTFVRAILATVGQKESSTTLTVLTGSGALFLIAAHVVYVPSVSLTLLMFFFIGLLLSSLRGTPQVTGKKILFSADPKLGFVSILSVVVFVLLAFTFFFFAGRLYIASIFYEQSLAYSSRGDFENAESNARRSLLFAEHDRTYRVLALASLERLSSIVQSGEKEDEAQQKFNAALTDMFSASQRALLYNPENFANWMVQGSVHSAATQLGIEGAYENTISVYEEARKRNPGTPEVDFRLAQLELVRGDDDAARSYAEAALAKKSDYTPAILFIGQLALNEGNLKEAIRSVEAALVFEPRNSLLWYQLGVLHISDESYEDAARSFERALVENPNYANARFFLAHSYTFLERFEEAVPLIERLIIENPEDENLRSILAAIQRAENPFLEDILLPSEPGGGE